MTWCLSALVLVATVASARIRSSSVYTFVAMEQGCAG
jgi:hypothetical protein